VRRRSGSSARNSCADRRRESGSSSAPQRVAKGVSTGDFEEALVALLGKDAGGLSASTVGASQGGLVGRAHALEQAGSNLLIFKTRRPRELAG
jgi:hypothetical protein